MKYLSGICLSGIILIISNTTTLGDPLPPPSWLEIDSVACDSPFNVKCFVVDTAICHGNGKWTIEFCIFSWYYTRPAHHTRYLVLQPTIPSNNQVVVSDYYFADSSWLTLGSTIPASLFYYDTIHPFLADSNAVSICDSCAAGDILNNSCNNKMCGFIVELDSVDPGDAFTVNWLQGMYHTFAFSGILDPMAYGSFSWTFDSSCTIAEVYSLTPYNLLYFGSAGQPDFDNDGIADTIDNCINIPNPDQIDADDDGVGDACENVNPIPVSGRWGILLMVFTILGYGLNQLVRR